MDLEEMLKKALENQRRMQEDLKNLDNHTEETTKRFEQMAKAILDRLDQIQKRVDEIW